ncbi:hypothetical protein [Aneurinibacillus aneurinilyticus]|uniref:hypothetical protein n=1 Tax=Aneurinibacillus aneurinilyticus TaxID=1391 RepID=UPI003523B9FA
MSSSIKSIFIILLMATFIAVTSQAGISLITISDHRFNAILASRSGAMAWDKEATAEAGVIKLDEIRAVELAQNTLVANGQQLSDYEIFVVNNAPTLFTWRGKEHFFKENGVAVGFVQNGFPVLKTEEVRIKDPIQEEEKEEEKMEPETEVSE